MQLLPLGTDPRSKAPRSSSPTGSPVALGPADPRSVGSAKQAPLPLALLIEQVLNPCTLPDFEVTRRHAIAHLVIHQAQEAIAAIATCLTHPDPATQAQGIWALGELNCQDPTILQQLTQLLGQPQAPLRLILHTLTRLNYRPALPAIQALLVTATPTTNPLVRSAAIAALYRLGGDSNSPRAYLAELTAALRHSDARRRDAAFLDLLVAQACPSLAALSTSSSPLLTRLQALRGLADQGYASEQLTFMDLEPVFDNLFQTHAQALYPAALQHFSHSQMSHSQMSHSQMSHSQMSPSQMSHSQMSHSQMSHSQSGLQTIGSAQTGAGTAQRGEQVPAKANSLYLSLLQTLRQPQSQSFAEQLAAVVALGNYGDTQAIAGVTRLLDPADGTACPWELAYACLMALHRLGDLGMLHYFSDSKDWILRSKSLSLLNQS